MVPSVASLLLHPARRVTLESAIFHLERDELVFSPLPHGVLHAPGMRALDTVPSS